MPVRLHGQLVSAQQEERAGHLLDVVRTVGVEDVADLELLQRLLYLALLPQYQALHVVCVLTHGVRLLQLLLDDQFTFLQSINIISVIHHSPTHLVLLPDVVKMYQPVSPLQSRELWSFLEDRVHLILRTNLPFSGMI